MNIQDSIKKLVAYGLKTCLIEVEDTIYTVNSLLIALGRLDDALNGLSHLPMEVRRRDDLRRNLGVAPVITLMAQKDPEAARLKLQQFLRQNKDDGIKLFPLIDFYAKRKELITVTIEDAPIEHNFAHLCQVMGI